MPNKLVAGLAAGAAGTVALNVATYLDMALRGRPPSDLPARVAARLSEEADIPLDFDVDEAGDEGPQRVQHRHEAVGALLGYANGLGLGLAYGVVRIIVPRPPTWVSATLLGGAAMAASDVPATMLGLTDPREWGPSGWLADIGPHLAYGVVAAMTFDAVTR